MRRSAFSRQPISPEPRKPGMSFDDAALLPQMMGARIVQGPNIPARQRFYGFVFIGIFQFSDPHKNLEKG